MAGMGAKQPPGLRTSERLLSAGAHPKAAVPLSTTTGLYRGLTKLGFWLTLVAD